MTIFKITLKHEEHGELTTEVEIAVTTNFEDHYCEMAQAAQKNVASRFVDYESFGSDSVYADRLAVVGGEFSILDAVIVSADPLVRYAVLGEYTSDEQGLWDDWVYGSNLAEAEFMAKWEMAINEGVSRDNHSDFEGTMQDITIKQCDPEPVTLDEAKSFMGTIARMTVPGDENCGPESGQSDPEALHALVRKARDMLAGNHVAA